MSRAEKGSVAPRASRGGSGWGDLANQADFMVTFRVIFMVTFRVTSVVTFRGTPARRGERARGGVVVGARVVLGRGVGFFFFYLREGCV